MWINCNRIGIVMSDTRNWIGNSTEKLMHIARIVYAILCMTHFGRQSKTMIRLDKSNVFFLLLLLLAIFPSNRDRMQSDIWLICKTSARIENYRLFELTFDTYSTRVTLLLRANASFIMLIPSAYADLQTKIPKSTIDDFSSHWT